MNLILYINLIFLFVISYSCCSSDKSKEYKNTNDTTLSLVQDSLLNVHTTIKENAALINATIDSLKVVDDFQYQLYIAITKVSSIGAIDNFAEVGQRIKVQPNYVLDEVKRIDPSNVRNKRLQTLKKLKANDEFSGKIVLDGSGKWFLVDVIE